MEKNNKEQRISIRFPLDILVAIREQAKGHDRSFNGEVISMLRTLLSQEKQMHEHGKNLSTE